jgi:hypothetical protein
MLAVANEWFEFLQRNLEALEPCGGVLHGQTILHRSVDIATIRHETIMVGHDVVADGAVVVMTTEGSSKARPARRGCNSGAMCGNYENSMGYDFQPGGSSPLS